MAVFLLFPQLKAQGHGPGKSKAAWAEKPKRLAFQLEARRHLGPGDQPVKKERNQDLLNQYKARRAQIKTEVHFVA